MPLLRAPTSFALPTLLALTGVLAACAADAARDEESSVAESSLGSDACATHRALLQAALARNEGNTYEVDQYGSINHGRQAFNDRKLHGLGGNGRACADCHQANDNFQLSPATAKARWEALQACRVTKPDADDPLFRAIDADDFRTNGASASNFSNLVDNGLIRVTFPLPPTLKLIDPATGQPSNETSVDVWRSVPTIFNVKLTGPESVGPIWPRGDNRRGGYQIDARAKDLQDQAIGALFGHAEVKTAPDRTFLDEIAAFENHMFSSEGVRAMSNAIDNAQPVPDPDPELTAEEAAGKVVFNRACGSCHGGPGQATGVAGMPRYHNIQSGCPRPVDGPQFPGYAGTARFQFQPCAPSIARNTRLYQVTRPNGQITRRPSSDPGRTLLTGFASLGGGPPPLVPPPLDDWGAFDVPQVRHVSKTAPYFHNNSAATIDDMLDHYREFFKFIAVVAPPPPAPRPPPLSTDGVNIDRPFTEAERPLLKAYLMKL